MKRLIKMHSIKMRIALMYAATAVAIAVVYAVFLYIVYFSMAQSLIENRLMTAAEWVEMAIWLNDSDEVYIEREYLTDITEAPALIYQNNVGYLYGRAADAIEDLPYEEDESMRVITVNGRRIYVYDYRTFDIDYTEPQPDVWIRTYLSAESARDASEAILKIGLALLPLMAGLAALCGYFITRRAFYPVAVIEGTAREIADSSDLSKRIELPQQTKDELSQLVATFNHMFEKLEASFISEKQFTSDASHELRTPLTVIRAQAEGLEKRLSNDPEAQADCAAVRVILKQCRAMQKLIGELLTVSRMENDRLALQAEDVDLGDLARAVAGELAETADMRGISIRVEAEPGVVVRADQTMMMCVLVNLIRNAIDYGQDGGHVWVDVRKADGFARCDVRDDGVGMTEAQLAHCWDRFYRADESRNSEGLGLGLFMVKWIVERYGGHIEATGELGAGSRFELTVPLATRV